MRAIQEQRVREARVPVVLAPIPLAAHTEERADPELYLRRFREFETLEGVTLHDFVADLRRYPHQERRSFRFATDIHPTPAGHEALAASLEPAIRDLIAGSGAAPATVAPSTAAGRGQIHEGDRSR